LSTAELWLALRATLALLRARVDLPRVRLPDLQASLAAGRSRPADPVRANAIRRAMQRAARTLPRSTCLAQSIAAVRLLRAEALPVELTVGVARGAALHAPANGVEAHAWVTSAGVFVAGGDDVSAYTELTRIGAGA
jgi:hypothetical protein